MRVSEVLDNPIIQLPEDIKNEKNTVVLSGPVYIKIKNLSQLNYKKYEVILIDNGQRRRIDLPVWFDSETKNANVEIFDGIFGDDFTEGVHTIAVLSKKTGKVVNSARVVFSHSTLRVIIDDLYLGENTEGRFVPKFTNDTAIYGDFRYSFYNAEKAIKVAEVLNPDQVTSNLHGSSDSPDILVVTPDGGYTAKNAGNVVIGVHMMSENAGMNKIQLLNIVVNDSRSVNIDEINRVAEAIERGELVKQK